MGEATEMILEGYCCQVCGEFIDEEGAKGLPRTCNCCEDASDEDIEALNTE